ncbi:MAG: ECF transporter S component, partial [Firmicutes bacterium]|nr:ECF transporter S component [Bacillota bacterium]
AGIVLGPVGGIVTACVGDVLGQTILPSGIGSLNPFITLSNTLFALFPALMYQYSPLRKIGGLDWLNILIGMIISTLVCTLGISSWAIWAQNFSSMGYWEYFVFNRLPQPIMVAVNYVSIIALLPALKRAKITNLKFLERVQAADKYTKDKDGK